MLVSTRWILRLFNWANWLIGALMLLIIIVTLFHPDRFTDAMQHAFKGDALAAERAEATLLTLRIMGAITLVIVPLAHIILTRLMKMVDSVVAGRPFATANIAHLRAIAWSLLAMNLADLGYGALAAWATPRIGEYLGWSLSLTGWIAVILLFILARIFEQGAVMQDELEGTV